MGTSRGGNKPKDLHALIIRGTTNELFGGDAEELDHGFSLNGIVCAVRLCAEMTQILFDRTECPHGVIEMEIGILGIGGSVTLTTHGTKELLKTGAIKGSSKGIRQIGAERIGLHISGFLNARNRLCREGHPLDNGFVQDLLNGIGIVKGKRRRGDKLKESLGFDFIDGKRRGDFERLLHGPFHAEFGGTDGMIDALIKEG